MLSPRSLAVVPLVLLAACSSGSSSASSFSQPKKSAFHEGGCASVADAVLSLGKDAHTLAGGSKPDANMAVRLTSNQDVVYKATGTAEEKAAFSKLVVAVGIVRIRNDGNTYAKSLAQGMVDGYNDVIDVCTGKA